MVAVKSSLKPATRKTLPKVSSFTILIKSEASNPSLLSVYSMLEAVVIEVTTYSISLFISTLDESALSVTLSIKEEIL